MLPHNRTDSLQHKSCHFGSVAHPFRSAVRVRSSCFFRFGRLACRQPCCCALEFRFQRRPWLLHSLRVSDAQPPGVTRGIWQLARCAESALVCTDNAPSCVPIHRRDAFQCAARLQPPRLPASRTCCCWRPTRRPASGSRCSAGSAAHLVISPAASVEFRTREKLWWLRLAARICRWRHEVARPQFASAGCRMPAAMRHRRSLLCISIGLPKPYRPLNPVLACMQVCAQASWSSAC